MALQTSSVGRRAFLGGGAMAGTAIGALAALGADLQPKVARAQELRIKNAKAFPSVCPYCAVGCGTLVHVVDDKIVNIEGNPASPINQGNLCPKGAASYELVTHPGRATKVKYRAPRSRAWVELDLESAVDMVADRMWTSRNRTFDEEHMHTTGIAHLGGATLDVEENYLIKKLFTAGLGMVCLSNQARI